jgi:hypothetical protein
MAIEYIFQFQADGASADDIKNAIIREFGDGHFEISHYDGNAGRKTILVNENITISIGLIKDIINDNWSRNYYGNTFQNHYKFTPDYDVNFRAHKNRDQQFMEEQTKSINCLLKNFDGDAIYLQDHGVPRLWRRDGVLYLAENDAPWQGYWNYDLATLFEMPYKFENMPDHFE